MRGAGKGWRSWGPNANELTPARRGMLRDIDERSSVAMPPLLDARRMCEGIDFTRRQHS